MQDLATYEARWVEPLSMSWNGFQIQSPPLTSGGLTVFQILHALKAMDWPQSLDGVDRLHAKIEAMRLAWNDRLTLLGDPRSADIPIPRLLSPAYAEESAARIREAVDKHEFIPHPVNTKTQGGTISLSAGDRQGNMAVLTLTHGEAFGSRITVDGLGLTLGHGMSRFDPRPDHPNAPGPGKRPLHNMVPTIVSRDGKAVLAVGGRGGRRIINAVLETLIQYVALSQSMAASLAAPRIHTEGDTRLGFEKNWPPSEMASLQKLGYSVKTEASATLSAVAFENGRSYSAMR